jgi:hypothetical protein
MLIKFVAINSVTSQFMVSIMGSAVIDPWPISLAVDIADWSAQISFDFPALSNSEAWTLNTSAG